MLDYITLGPTPSEETCFPNTHPASVKEAHIYKRQLQRQFPIPDNLNCHLRFAVKMFPHDFGAYAEVVLYYDPSDLHESNFAYNVEDTFPNHWDAAALVERAALLESLEPSIL